MPESGVSSPGRHVDIASASSDTSQTVARPSVLRCPELKLTAWFRVAELSHTRGILPASVFRCLQFLSQEAIDPLTGRVIGEYGTGRVDGGERLAEGYARVHDIGTDRFWHDLGGAYRYGFAEQLVKPAPGRRAVYALCLRADAIPSDLPDDLTRQLKPWDLPEAVDPHEDFAYGWLTSRQAPAVEPFVVLPEQKDREAAECVARFAHAPRWEHPAGTTAAMVAQSIRKEWQRADATDMAAADPWPGWEPIETPQEPLQAPSRPKSSPSRDHRVYAVADPDKAAEIKARVERLQAQFTEWQSVSLYAKGYSPLHGFVSADRSSLSPAHKDVEQTKTTPTAAPKTGSLEGCGEDFSAVATRAQRRVWASWRAQLGRYEVILETPTPEELSRSQTGDLWSDLHRVMVIALRRGATESQLVEVLTSNIVQYDQWGNVKSRATTVGRLAAWRLWRLVDSLKDARGYHRIPNVPQAPHVTEWDDTERTAYRRARVLNGHGDPLAVKPGELQERQESARRAAFARVAAEAREAKRSELAERWNLERFAPATDTTPDKPTPRIGRPDSAESRYAAAVRQARADKRARRQKG